MDLGAIFVWLFSLEGNHPKYDELFANVNNHVNAKFQWPVGETVVPIYLLTDKLDLVNV